MRSRSTLRAAIVPAVALRAALLLLCICASAAFAPGLSAKDPTFQWLYGAGGYDIFYGLTTTADGGYLAVGTSSSYNGSDRDVYVVRTDACGALVWSATYDIGHGGYDVGYKVVRGLDGGYVIVGTTQNTLTCCQTGYDPFVMKIDDAGNVIWAKTYPALDDDDGFDIATYSNTGYVIAGRYNSIGNGQGDGFLMRIDLAGTPTMARTYGGAGFDELTSVAVAANGDIIAAGRTFSYTTDNFEKLYLVRTNPDLTPQWSYFYGADSTIEAANDVLAMKDGSIAVFGRASSKAPFYYEQPYLLRLTSTGACQCDQVFAVADTNRGELTEARELPNGELAATGFYFNEAAGLGRFDMLLMRIDGKCNRVWAEQYGVDWRDQGFALVPLYTAGVTLPTNYIVAGSTNSFNGGGFDDAYLVRADRNGISGCNEYETVMSARSPGFCARKAPTVANAFLVGCATYTGPDYNTDSELLCRICDIPDLNVDPGDGLLSHRSGATGTERIAHPNGVEMMRTQVSQR
ncbi:MAG TPA: hypothetical protein VHI13_10945 [Candidatus Kapabacteria bacterium]|nr:hypothetical protein [Candidatus Kapabacteria bacterium]